MTGLAEMDSRPEHLAKIGFLAFVATVGFDLFLHAGVLAPLYSNPSAFLLPLPEAFRRIPIGYLSFGLMILVVIWLMKRIGILGWAAGMRFGLAFGAAVWGSFTLGLASISTAPLPLLVGWFVGQTAEVGVIGLVVGSGLANSSLRSLTWKVLTFSIAAAAVGVAIQNILNHGLDGS